MAYNDPQSVTVGGAAVSLPRVSSSENAGAFRSADQTTSLEVSHTYASRIRRLVRLRNNLIVANPLVPNQNMAVNSQVYFVLDQPKTGYAATELVAQVKALAAWLATGTNAEKFVTGEM